MNVQINSVFLSTNDGLTTTEVLAFIIVIGTLVSIFVINNIIEDHKKRKRNYDVPYDNHNKEYFITQAKEITLSILKTPAIAQFNSIEVKCMDSYKRVYVETVVDSQNSYGAYIRSTHGILFIPNKDHTAYRHFIQDIHNPYEATHFKLEHGWNAGLPNFQ